MELEKPVLEAAGLGAYYTDHGLGIYPQAAAGFPYTAATDAVTLRIPI